MQLSDEVAAFVQRQPVGRLATADVQGRPHVIPVCFVYEDGAFYSAVDEKPKRTLRLKRLRNLMENPQVALVIDVYHEDWSKLAWVMVQGKASIFEQGRVSPTILAALRHKYPPYAAMTLEERPLIQIVVEHVTTWGTFG